MTEKSYEWQKIEKMPPNLQSVLVGTTHGVYMMVEDEEDDESNPRTPPETRRLP